jgi:glycosyltransferase involved in cell wall biosynthesis
MRAVGHEVEEFFLPFPTTTRAALSAMIGLRATPLMGSGDRLIAIRWPSHIVRHDNKVTWFIHHHRELFDLWDTEFGVRASPEAIAYREAIRRIDNQGFRESRDVFTNSLVVRDRVREFNDVEAEPLFPPLGGDTTRFRNEAYGDFVFYPSRITPIKRQLLAIEAMRFTSSPVRLVIAGQSESDSYEKKIRDFVKDHDLENRVELLFGWLEEEAKADLLARCLALAYLPVSEDSYGYPSLEASHCAKPIITLKDSGGTLEFVRGGMEGLVTNPNPRDLASAFDRLYEDRTEAERLGAQSYARRDELNISWPHVISRLLGEAV